MRRGIDYVIVTVSQNYSALPSVFFCYGGGGGVPIKRVMLLRVDSKGMSCVCGVSSCHRRPGAQAPAGGAQSPGGMLACHVTKTKRSAVPARGSDSRPRVSLEDVSCHEDPGQLERFGSYFGACQVVVLRQTCEIYI